MLCNFCTALGRPEEIPQRAYALNYDSVARGAVAIHLVEQVDF